MTLLEELRALKAESSDNGFTPEVSSELLERVIRELEKGDQMMGKAAEAMGCIRMAAHTLKLAGENWSEEPGFSNTVLQALWNIDSLMQERDRQIEKLESELADLKRKMEMRDTVSDTKIEDLEGVLRGLASYLGCGGYNADVVIPEKFDAKIRDGIKMATEDATRLLRDQLASLRGVAEKLAEALKQANRQWKFYAEMREEEDLDTETHTEATFYRQGISAVAEYEALKP